MIYIVPEIALATRGDIVGILDLQEQNLLGRGGLLSVRLPGAFIEAALDDLPQIVARRDGKIVAYLLAGSRSVHAQTPIIKAMFRAYSGSHDAYIYGPICVAESERGHGLATALFAEMRKRLPERECVAFVRRDNAASLRAHLKMGMKDVASLEHDGVAHAVCELACKKDPLFGVIGIQSGPQHRGPKLASVILGSRGWDAGRGDDWEDLPSVF